MVALWDYLDERLVKFIEADTRDEVLRQMIDLLDKVGKLADREAFAQAIANREKILSTGIGMGVAIPHAKLASCTTFFIAIGVLRKGVDWKALDGASVRLVFLMGGPDDRQTEYLQILSRLTLAIRDVERRKKLLQLREASEIIALFRGF